MAPRGPRFLSSASLRRYAFSSSSEPNERIVFRVALVPTLGGVEALLTERLPQAASAAITAIASVAVVIKDANESAKFRAIRRLFMSVLLSNTVSEVRA